MPRKYVHTIRQPDEVSCGPVSVSHALKIFGKRKPLTPLKKLCRTNRNGTSTKNLIGAFGKLGFHVMKIERATLRHVVNSLRYPSDRPRAVLVSYLYDTPWSETGHWATVSSFSTSKNRITLFDSFSGRKKSYTWGDFRERWIDFDLKRVSSRQNNQTYKYVKKWQRQLLLVVAKDKHALPKFQINTSEVYHPQTSRFLSS